MTTQNDIAAIERLLEKKQAVPSQMIRNIVIDLKAQIALATAQRKHIAELEKKLEIANYNESTYISVINGDLP